MDLNFGSFCFIAEMVGNFFYKRFFDSVFKIFKEERIKAKQEAILYRTHIA